MRSFTAGILCLALSPLVACGHRVVGWETPDGAPPVVTSTTPVRNTTAAALNAPISATFSEEMAPATINGTTFLLEAGTSPVPGTVMHFGVTSLFTPDAHLDPETLYRATITTGVTDLAGNAMAANYTWTFVTGVDVDDTAPWVTATNPVGDATDVSVNASVIAIFNEAMDPATITATTFTLLDGTTLVAGMVGFTGVTATFNPAGTLADDTTYVARIGTGAKDLAGNALIDGHEWTFTTGRAPDLTAPRVTSTVPENGATDVLLDAPVTAIFSEAMDPATITAATFTLRDGTTPVPGTVTLVGVTATFRPAADLPPDTLVSATISTVATDLAGNPLAANHAWTFTTGPLPETQAPRVISTVPADDAEGVPVESNLTAIFSEAMDPATITPVNFTLQQLGTPVPGTVTYAGLTATFHPTSALALDATYAATITTASTDLAGNALESNFVWNFTTGILKDTTRPAVFSTIPGTGATAVVRNTNVTAVFSEPMDPLTLTTASFTLLDGLVPIAGTVTPVGALVTFDPTVTLDPDTEYTATVTSGATDLAGNALSTNHAWTFTTGSVLDDVAPTVIATNPADLATNVPLNAAVNATFSEPMAFLTVSPATFTLTGPGTTAVTGSVLYDVSTSMGTFTPQVALLPATTYTATITTGAADMAGSAMLADYAWSFSTGETASGLLPINLRSLGTFVAVAGAGLTNSNSSGITTLNGDVGLSPTGTCLGDGSPCTLTNPVINGTLYANDPAGVAAQAKVDLTAAYVEAMARPVGTTVNDLSGMVLAPGVYTSNSTMSVAVGGTVTLDGKGDANATWIFQIGSSLTVNNDAQVLLINGARARNVFWAAFASSTLGSNVRFQGSVLAGASNSVGTDSVVVGRLLCTTGQISLLSDTVTLPPD